MLTFIRMVDEISAAQNEAFKTAEVLRWLDDGFRSKIIKLILKFSMSKMREKRT